MGFSWISCIRRLFRQTILWFKTNLRFRVLMRLNDAFGLLWSYWPRFWLWFPYKYFSSVWFPTKSFWRGQSKPLDQFWLSWPFLLKRWFWQPLRCTSNKSVQSQPPLFSACASRSVCVFSTSFCFAPPFAGWSPEGQSWAVLEDSLYWAVYVFFGLGYGILRAGSQLLSNWVDLFREKGGFLQNSRLDCGLTEFFMLAWLDELAELGAVTVAAQAPRGLESGSSEQKIFGGQFILSHVLWWFPKTQKENYNITQNQK